MEHAGLLFTSIPNTKPSDNSFSIYHVYSSFSETLCPLDARVVDDIPCSDATTIKRHFARWHKDALPEAHWELVEPLIWSEVISEVSEWESCSKSSRRTFDSQFWAQGYANDEAVNTDDLRASVLPLFSHVN